MTAVNNSPETIEFEVAGEVDRQQLDQLFDMAYQELRRLAWQVNAGGASKTLNPTALVNEVWLRLSGAPKLKLQSYVHFKHLAAKAMRQVLIESARRKTAQKRGGEGAVLVPLDDFPQEETLNCHQELVALDGALQELAQLSPRQATIVEGKFFGGLEFRELADLLFVSESTIVREWRIAKAWLGQQMKASM